MKNFLRLSVVSVIAMSLLLGGISLAQDNGSTATQTGNAGTGFRVSPTRDEFDVDKGMTVTKKISVRNVTTSGQTARAVIDDFTSSGDENGSPKLLIGANAVDNYVHSIKPFVLSINDISLKAGEEKDVLVSFSVPADTSPGSYYGLVRFVTLNDENPDGFDYALSLNASVGVVYLINVPGETVDLLSLEQITILKDGKTGGLFSSAPDTIGIRLKNEGNTFQAPFGRILVKNWGGDKIFEYEINGTDPRGNVLPDSIRSFQDPIENIGSFGRFTVEANISYGDGGSIISDTLVFWVVPWMQIGLGLAGAIIVVFGGIKGLKAYNRKVVEDSKGVRVKKK